MNSARPLAPTPAAPAASISIGLAPDLAEGTRAERRSILPAAFATDTVEGFLAELGPARPWTYLAILALAATALAALPLVQVDVTLGAPAHVRATSERAEIRAPTSGRIARLRATDNQPVSAGDPLLELDTTALDARLAHNRARQQHARDVLQDLSRLSAAADGVAVFHHLTTSSAAADHPVPLPLGTSRLAPGSSLLSSGFRFQVSGFPQPPPLSADPRGSTVHLPRPLPAAFYLSRGSCVSWTITPTSDSRDPFSFQHSSFRSQVSGFSPAAETGAVAAEVSERSAAGAPLKIAGYPSSGFRFQVSGFPQPPLLSADQRGSTVYLPRPLPAAFYLSRGSCVSWAIIPTSDSRDPFSFQHSSFRSQVSGFSPAAETGAVAAEVSERSAAGAPLRIADLKSEISDHCLPIPRRPAAGSRPGSPITIHSSPFGISSGSSGFSFQVSSFSRPQVAPPLATSASLDTRSAPISADQRFAPPPASSSGFRFQVSGFSRPEVAPPFSTPEIAAEHADFRARLSGLELAAARARAEHARITHLSDQGLVSRRDQDEARFALARAEAEIDILRRQSLARWQARRRDEELALIALVSEEAHLGDERTSFHIAAPATGAVLGLGGLAEGAWVAAGQSLGVVSPDDDLLVEAAVPPHRIGFVREGQPVRLAIDTYAATTWGTVAGRVVGVSADLHAGAPGSAFYRVLIRPEDLSLRRGDGSEAPLRKGMTAQARFIVARCTLLQLLHEETSRWLDPRAASSSGET